MICDKLLHLFARMTKNKHVNEAFIQLVKELDQYNINLFFELILSLLNGN